MLLVVAERELKALHHDDASRPQALAQGFVESTRVQPKCPS
jgi:hypothetical protein